MKQRIKGLLALLLVFAMVLGGMPAEARAESSATDLVGTVTLYDYATDEPVDTICCGDIIASYATIDSPAEPGELTYSFWRQTANGEAEKIEDGDWLYVTDSCNAGDVIWAEVTAENASGTIRSQEYTVQKGVYSENNLILRYYDKYGTDEYSDALVWSDGGVYSSTYCTNGTVEYRIMDNGTWSDWKQSIGEDDGYGYLGTITIGNVNRAAGDIEIRIPDNSNYQNPDPENPIVWTNTKPFTAVNATLTGTAKVGETLTATVEPIDAANFPGDIGITFQHDISYKFIRVNKNGSETELQNGAENTYTIQEADLNSKIKVEIMVTVIKTSVTPEEVYKTYGPITLTGDTVPYEPLSGTATIIASSGEELSGLEIPYGTSLEVRLEGTTAAMGEECSYQWYCLTQGAETPEVIRVYNIFSHYAWENVKVGDTLWAEITGAGGGTVATPEYTVTKGYYYIEDTFQMSLDMYGTDALILGVDPSVLVGVDFEYRIRESADVVWPEEWTACELVVGEYIGALATVGNNDIPADCVQIRPKETEYFSVHPDDIDTYLWTNDAPFTKAEVSLTGTAKIGETLTAEVSLPDDANFPDTEGNGTQSVIYTFKRGATTVQEGEENTYVIQPADAGSVITVEVKVVYTYSDPESETVTYGPLTATGVAVPGVYSEADFYFTVDNEWYDEYGDDKMDWIANKKTEGKIQYRVKNSNGVWSDWMDSTGYEVGNGAAYGGVIKIGNVTLGAGDIEIRIPDNDRYANPDPDNPMIWTNDEEYLFTAVNTGLIGNAKVGEILTASLTLDERNFPYIAYPEFIKYEVSYKFIGVGETGSETELQNSTAATYTLRQTDVGSKIKVEITVTVVAVDGSASQALPPLTVTMDETVAAVPTPTPTVAPTATPTVAPTATPTPKPTATPTVAPTATPTPKPTATPTVAPTATPTPKPTATPTVAPTATPTVAPTATPTPKPTATPTVAPTATPTVAPTATPTVAPTATPTATPTVAPTATPTVAPTATPTVAPTATPKPVVLPTPTVAPTPIPEELPQIQGEDGKSGWDAISDEITAVMKDAEDIEERAVVTVDMNGTTKVPQEIFVQIAGEDISVEFVLDNGLKWTVNGKSVKAENLKDIDFAVTFETGENPLEGIPVKVINKVTGERTSIEIRLAHSGKFGFEAVLTVELDEKNAGLYANLFFYNPETKELEFICVDLIAEDGTADLTFTHASDYLIVLSEDSMDPEADEPEEKEPEEKEPEVKEPVLMKGYTVQIGAFSKKANAEKWEKKGEAVDVPMFIIEDGNLFKVQTDVFETKAEAAAVAKKLAAAGLENFILKTERWVTPEGEEAPEEPTKPTTPVLPPETDKKTIEALAKEVIAGKWGNGTERKERLTEAGYDYREVQNKVNELLK